LQLGKRGNPYIEGKDDTSRTDATLRGTGGVGTKIQRNRLKRGRKEKDLENDSTDEGAEMEAWSEREHKTRGKRIHPSHGVWNYIASSNKRGKSLGNVPYAKKDRPREKSLD